MEPSAKPAIFDRWVIAVLTVLTLAAAGCLTAAMQLGPIEAPATKKATLRMPEKLPQPVIVAPLTRPVAASPSVLLTPSPSQPLTSPSLPRWVTNASPKITTNAPKIALIIDDMGGLPAETAQAIAQLPSPTTFAFLPYAANVKALANQVRNAGHEVLIHVPMQPKPRQAAYTPDAPAAEVLNPGPNTLLATDTPEQLATKLAANLNGLKHIAVGINNHMGSAFTQSETGMRTVLQTLEAEQLLFLDSKTTAPTATRKAAQGLALPILTRNVFLDDTPDNPASIRTQLQRAASYAKQHGSAIAIGHPHPSTLQVLAEELPNLTGSGIVLVPLTSVLPH